MCGYVRFVRDHNDGLALLVQLIYQRHDLLAGFTVQVAGGFIRQQYRRVAHQCPCNSNTLALPARQLVGPGIEAITQANVLKGFAGNAFALCTWNLAVDQWLHHIF
jgi:hypothetical protein